MLAYFVVGAVIMRVKYEATGTDIIPNKNFWFNIPFLIKVKNVVFTVSLFFNFSVQVLKL